MNQRNDSSMVLEQIVRGCRVAAAHGDPGVLSTGEKLAAAIVLNRADWLASLGYTMTEALTRLGPEWVALLGAAARVLEDDERIERLVAEGIAKARVRPTPQIETTAAPTTIDYQATLVTYGQAPGYRDVDITLDLREIDGTLDGHQLRACIRLSADDGVAIARHIRDVHASAWSSARGPIDRKDGEEHPGWLREN